MPAASDYDARRIPDSDAADPSGLRELAPTLPRSSTATIDAVDDDPNAAPVFEPPGADLSGEELSVAVIPQRSDEFICSCCYLVQHRSRLRSSIGQLPVCADCV
ncbi:MULTISPECIES: DUF4193 domain-containing protein [Mycobacterium]|uniref:dUTPase n=4 Tax=Mycobacterium ulcerans group TaxID=2993898 RepID=B2HK85_MYCMM|nr:MULTISPECIES: DUF4193 domain-containing protein [Mycobacterium]ULL08618.1 DUF4193 domain-containing protein [Mycobacterium liflandii]ACC43582.1 conserved hypothetical protein [Mycobacterium marinum M]AGC64876.1 hypothetical protein MULP_05452 [Mycobacterium liflandii 128FXT]EPQ44645.1 hypothetical protein MMSP_0405 [Mycobacterium sp. 012931]EPQ78861.1 hypothetical protein MMMB2_3523 [Mycobacterium marinum MB2]